ACPTGPCCSTGSATRCRSPDAAAQPSPCCASTWTGSSSSTRASVMRRATRSCSRWSSGSARCCARATRWPTRARTGWRASPEATPESLLRDAGNARHRAKERGRARFELFDPALHARVADRLSRETELRQALERDQLCVHYQPIVSVRDGEWVGAEALVRWNHPDRGVLLPADFLPLAEETGLIVPLGRWVMEHACAQAARWQLGVCRTRPYRVSVNLSGHQLLHDDVKAMTIESMEASELDPSR